jgi:hypothetical protein
MADNRVVAAKVLRLLRKNSDALFLTAEYIMAASEVQTYALGISRTLKYNHCI